MTDFCTISLQNSGKSILFYGAGVFGLLRADQGPDPVRAVRMADVRRPRLSQGRPRGRVRAEPPPPGRRHRPGRVPAARRRQRRLHAGARPPQSLSSCPAASGGFIVPFHLHQCSLPQLDAILKRSAISH